MGLSPSACRALDSGRAAQAVVRAEAASPSPEVHVIRSQAATFGSGRGASEARMSLGCPNFVREKALRAAAAVESRSRLAPWRRDLLARGWCRRYNHAQCEVPQAVMARLAEAGDVA